ncbi:MAG: DUF6316 family protein [Thioalkalispiraceae bacterium]|jgi:hypothetical protein
MTQNRRGESGSTPFRTGRIFNVGAQWYFATREGVDHGPYTDKSDAEAELSLFIRDKLTSDQRIN